MPMRRFCILFLIAGAHFLSGCGANRPPRGATVPEHAPTGHSTTAYGGKSDPEEVRAADISILFVGNSHTTVHDVPNLVCDLIRHRYPDKRIYAHVVNVGFLDDEPTMPWCKEEIETQPWKFVVLQGQKISMRGRVQYYRS